VSACPTGALRLGEGKEVVPTFVSALCDECLACLEICSTGAIQRAAAPEPALVVAGEVVEGEVVGGEVLPSLTCSRPLEPQLAHPRAGLAGTALALVGSWLLPRAADALLDAIGRRLAGGANSAAFSRNEPLKSSAAGTRGGQGRQHRRRRGR
jgi:hypothetical protein